MILDANNPVLVLIKLLILYFSTLALNSKNDNFEAALIQETSPIACM